jgi:hypothetical protein
VSCWSTDDWALVEGDGEVWIRDSEQCIPPYLTISRNISSVLSSPVVSVSYVSHC